MLGRSWIGRLWRKFSKQRRIVELDSCYAQRGNREQELVHPIAPLVVQRNGEMRPITQYMTDETCHDAAWTDFDENPCSVRVHGLNLLTETHRLDQLVGDECRQFGDFRIILPGGGIRIDIKFRRAELLLSKQLFKRRHRLCDNLGMEGGGHRKHPRLKASRVAFRLGRLNCLLCA